MKNVSLSEAKANIDDVLRTVESGEAVTIQPDAPLTPEEEEARAARIRWAIEGIKELRKHTKPVSVEEIIAWKNEGRE
ncbi:prevent-host-death protein [Tardiphaga alba]|uniref:Prevent-host-death protein n=1 Tax=Tardiphaga alba TaxID=340268 RepID=A0ABX8A3D6_9BRAD|nr:prevent-host-death protein [Tardiphaga alba]QUS37731.1 prevent-host-death protein [Tardiphaga alba]